jgi:hypothetical protein
MRLIEDPLFVDGGGQNALGTVAKPMPETTGVPGGERRGGERREPGFRREGSASDAAPWQPKK